MEAWRIVTSVALPLVTLAGFILTVVWNVRKHREQRETSMRDAQAIAVREAEERGKMEERQITMEKQIDAAHDKIRELDSRHDILDTRMAEFATDLKHVVKSVDALVAIHTKKE